MAKKLGRNEPCWCGSGLKFKKCHLNRENEEPLGRSEAEKITKGMSSKKTCLAPDEFSDKCTRKKISAHTVSKKSSLEKISHEGHVLGLKPSLSSLTKNNGQIVPEKIGINKASTFTGFCSYHDSILFSPIEDTDFVGSQEQFVLFAYRPLCRELYAKESIKPVAGFMKKLDKGLSTQEQQFIQANVSYFEQGNDVSYNDLKYLKKIFDNALVNKQYDIVSSLVIKLNEPPPIMGSSTLAPSIDFSGNTTQDMEDLSIIVDYIFINFFASNGSGYIVISWLKDQYTANKQFIESLLKFDKRSITDALTRFMFSFIENIYISPKWWESLDVTAQQNINERILHGVPFPRPKNCLKEDGVFFGDWGVEEIELYNVS